MAINWPQLRNWNGDQRNSFEELCCQLVAQEPVQTGSRFFRKGRPDAGLECYWRLPNGDEWGMQAKFFLTSPSSGQWSQINDSVKRAIEAHPRLTKLYICLPTDLPDAPSGAQQSAQQRWDEHVGNWRALASDHNMSVEFEYWGESQIGGRLSSELNLGRHWFWFNDERLSNEWFRHRIDEAVDNARDRYSPEINVDLPIRETFDALGRTSRFFEKFEAMYSEAKIQFKRLRPSANPAGSTESQYEIIRSQAANLFSKMEPWIKDSGDYFEWTVTRPIPWIDIEASANELIAALQNRISEIRNLQNQTDETGTLPGKSQDTLNWERHLLYQFQQSISEILDYSLGTDSKVSNLPYLLMTGDAGQGKTHLLCQIGKEQTYDSRPRVIFHGERFINDEPWSQMTRMLGLDCNRDQFIGALEATAQANGCRVLIFIDALNEGEGKRLWAQVLPGILTTLARSPWLGLCVSVRTSYEKYVVPDTLDESRIARIEHRGFTELPYEAVSSFFSHYDIEPSTPFLVPEFTNPLFLKLFCQSLQNQGLTTAPSGLQGITSIFRFYVDALDAKLSRHLDYDVREPKVAAAVGQLADAMAKIIDDRLPLDEAKAIVDAVLPPQTGFQNSLFNQMESEGLLTTLPDYSQDTADTLRECVRFTYQRFSDHMVVHRLLEQNLDVQNPETSFSAGTTLGKLVEDERACWINSGLIEALMVQIPELSNMELTNIAPHIASFDAVREAFVKSLVWREASSFSPSTDDYVDQQVLKYRGTADDFWNSVITLSPLPEHPYNADRLHKVLSGINMPDRDAWWSIYLHHAWGSNESIDRLVEWAWEETDKSTFDDEVIRLAGVTIAWFFTSANRFLRDKATKAMVRLLESRIKVLIEILTTMADVDDMYVLERLYAVSYGCAMRTADIDSLELLANHVYQLVFESGSPTPHILMRDYARGVIEVATYRGANLDIDVEKVRPPYKSEWPSLSIPTDEELQEWRRTWDGMPDSERARILLYNSVMGGDFSIYVIDGLNEWSSERLDEPHVPTHRELCDQFILSLTSEQKEAWDVYDGLRLPVYMFQHFGTKGIVELFGGGSSVQEFATARTQAEDQFVESLGPNSDKYQQFIEVVKPYRENPAEFSSEQAFDGNLARRWIMQRVTDLGWTVDRFGDFDRWVNYGHARDAMKPERIGKKYQWLAYHELLARISDNFRLREDSWRVQSSKYNGPWNFFRHGRDIDPSNLLTKTQAEMWEPHSSTWWFPSDYTTWDEPPDEVDWIRKTTDLPEIKDIIEVVEPEGDSRWITLHGFFRWEQPTPPGEEHYEQKRREIAYILNGYFIKKSDMDEVREWASHQAWWNRWMPESHESYEIFLGEFFWSPAFKDQDIHYYSRQGWTRGNDDVIPAPILVANDEYGRSRGSFDCSIDESIFIDLPCHFLVEGMNLDWKGIEGSWFDPAGQLVGFDPSVKSPGPRTFLVRKDSLIEFLDANGLTLFWTVLGEKQTIGGSMSHQDYKGHLVIKGAYFLVNGTVSGEMSSDYVSPPSD